MKKNIISLLCLITCCFSLAAQDFKSLFNDKISTEDLQKLLGGPENSSLGIPNSIPPSLHQKVPGKP